MGIAMTFKELLKRKDLIHVQGYAEPLDASVTDVVTAVEMANAATLYVACNTAIRDGHGAALAAYERGCRHFVAERMLTLPSDAAQLLTANSGELLGELAAAVHGYPARGLTVVGITGTHGKTTVALLAAGFLAGCGRRVAMLTTDGTDIGGVFTPQGELAPDGADLARFFRSAADAGAEIAIVELSAYMLAHGATAGIPFTVVLCTDFSPRHIGKGEHADLAAYRAAKARLLEGDAPLAVMPANSTDFSPRGRAFTYGFEEKAADLCLIQADTPCAVAYASKLTLYCKGKEYGVETPLYGAQYFHDLAAAMALSVVLGESPVRFVPQAPRVYAVGRLELLRLAGDRTVCFDAAYEAEDLSLVLKTLRARTAGRLTVLLGSVGGRAHARRAPLGAAALAGADFVYLTADDPNSESVLQIAHDMVGENGDAARYRIIASRAEAIGEAAFDLRSGDTLLILGKPREDTQLQNGKKHFFSDRLAVLNAIREE